MENYVGKRLDGRYEIIEIIGVGGMAVVYKAFDNIDNRIVAVKVLKDEFLQNEEFRRRFKNESKAIAVLSHPNIVKIYDVSYGDNLQYIVMEYVDGITLKEYIEQQGRLDIREAIYFVTQILRALQHAHDKGIVHRDIKPQNIMLLSDGTIKVTDFGIARFSRSETRTMTDGAIGSVHYISPEQAKGSVTDAKTDLYSVGVVLYEMLTGKVPFQSDNAVSVALMQLQNDPVRPRELNPDIPVGLEQIIIRAMQKSPNDRYQSASEMLMDIAEFKKNPNVKFDYSYFVDKQPTKYVPLSSIESAAKNSDKSQEDAYDEDEEDDSKAKKKTIGVLAGVLGVLILFAVIIAAIVLPDKNKVSVPDFIGLNFTNDVMNAEEYAGKFVFNCIEQASNDKANGTILDQLPKKGKKVTLGSEITLYVAKSANKVKIPDVYGYEYSTAQSRLKEMNFDTKIVKEKSSTKDAGTVIRTSPARDTEVDEGTLVIIYVATTEDAEPVDVPNLNGLTVEQARTELEKAGLTLDAARTEYRSNSAERGTIIGYEHVGEQVPPGTAIAVYVSTGQLPTQSTTESTTEQTTAEKTTTERTTSAPKRSTTLPPETESTTEPTKAPTEPTEKPATVPSSTESSDPVIEE